MSYNNNINLKIQAIAESGRADLTILSYEWKINNIIQANNTDILMVDTSTLPIGDNTISTRTENSCGKWSDINIQIINIIEVNNMEKIETVIVNQPTVPVAIVLPYTGAAEVTVTDGINPVAGATLDLDGTPTGLSTGVDGKASIPNVPYGTHTVKAIKI